MSSSAAMVVASLQVSQQLLPQTAHESAPYIPNPHITGESTSGKFLTLALIEFDCALQAQPHQREATVLPFD